MDRLTGRIPAQTANYESRSRLVVIDPKTELRRENLSPLDSVKDAYLFETRTPAHLFTYVVAGLSDGQRYIGLVTRDSFDRSLSSAIIYFVRKRYPELRQSVPSQILSGFTYERTKFDCILAINPDAYGLYAKESRLLHDHTIEVAPIYRCEFCGDETPEILQLVRRKYLDTLDWRREPSPRVGLAFFDAATGIRSTGHKLGLTTKKDAILKIRKVSQSTQSWAEIENYAGHRAHVSWDGHSYVIESKHLNLRAAIEISAIDEWIDRFLLAGIQSSSSPTGSAKVTLLRPNEPRLSVYLFDRERDRRIDSSEPIQVDLTRALDEFDRLSDTEGSFIGFRRSDNAVLQFIWNNDGTLDADIPVEGGSLQRQGTWEELRPLIEKFASGIPVDELPGFRFQAFPNQAKRS